MADSARARSMLRRLDDQVVPRLRRGSRAVARVVAWPVRGLRWLDERVAGGRLAATVTEHRAQVAFLVVLVAFGATAVHAQRYPQLRQAGDPTAGSTSVPSGRTDGADPTGDGDATDIATVVGPRLGARVASYLDERQSALEALAPDARVTAVVSFDALLAPAAAASLLDGVDDGSLALHAAQYRLPERDPTPAQLTITDDDLVGSAEDALGRLVDRLREEEEQVASTLESGVEDEAFRRDYETRLDELRSIRNVLTQDPAVLFAVVVDGPAATLRTLAAEPAVRLVDPVTQAVDIGRTAFYGLLPSDEERFSYGHTG